MKELIEVDLCEHLKNGSFNRKNKQKCYSDWILRQTIWCSVMWKKYNIWNKNARHTFGCLIEKDLPFKQINIKARKYWVCSIVCFIWTWYRAETYSNLAVGCFNTIHEKRMQLEEKQQISDVCACASCKAFDDIIFCNCR